MTSKDQNDKKSGQHGMGKPYLDKSRDKGAGQQSQNQGSQSQQGGSPSGKKPMPQGSKPFTDGDQHQG